MINGKRIAAVIVAAGKGLRMGGDTPKQYLELGGRTLLMHTAAAFEKSRSVDDVVIVCPSGDEGYVRGLVTENGFSKVVSVTEGGSERFDSCFAGIKAACADCAQRPDHIMIHDGVRALVTPELIDSTAEAMMRHPAVCPGVKAKETIRTVGSDGIAVSVPERESLRVIQTPQGFETGLIMKAYERFFKETEKDPHAAAGITDDAMLVEKYMQQKVFVAEGSYENIKITTPEDMLLAEAILKRRS